MFRKLSWKGEKKHPNNIYILFFVTLFFVQSSYKWWVNMQWVISFSLRLLNSEKEVFELAFGDGCSNTLRLEYKQAYALLLKDISLLKSFGEKTCHIFWNFFLKNRVYIYRVSQEEWTKLRESVPYVELYRYNPKHLYPKLNGYGDNGHRKVWASGVSTYCTPSVTP